MPLQCACSPYVLQILTQSSCLAAATIFTLQKFISMLYISRDLRLPKVIAYTQIALHSPWRAHKIPNLWTTTPTAGTFA